MTLNITKKKIEKVLELFNHPQTRKIRKNRGKKRRRNNKSFNRKNGRKNLATSTLKKKGGHPIFNGGQVGVVLGGQVGGKRGDVLKAIVSKLSDPLKQKLRSVLSEATEKKKALVAFVKQKIKITQKPNLNEEIDFTDLQNEDNEFEVTTKDIKDINDINIGDISDKDIDDISDEVITEVLNDTSEKSINTEPSGLQQEKVEGDNQNSDIKQEKQEDNPELETKPQQIQNKKVEKPKEESKNDKMMKLLTLREDYTIFNILNNLLPPKEEGQTADLKEIVKKLDFGKFVDEIGILKNDEEESTINEEGQVDGDGDGEEKDNDNEEGKNK